jgi:Leucine-rich repeat (LRR) protein
MLDNLEDLSIHGARLYTLDKPFGNLKNLKRISIRNSQVKEIGFIFNELQNLEILDFTNNSISSISLDFSKAINVRSIYLDNNPIDKIPESILNLPKIEIIGIAGTRISMDLINSIKLAYPRIQFITAKGYFSEIYQPPVKKRVR